MAIFVAIAIAAFIVVAGGFLLGHDHDFDHGFDGVSLGVSCWAGVKAEVWITT